MSYMRDRDHMTRGVGAIAATDANPAHQRARVQRSRATQARDRAMAAVSRGALGVITSGTFTEGGTYSPPRPTDIAFVPQAIIPVAMMPPTQALPAVSPGGATSPVVGTPSGVSMGPPPVSIPLPPIPILDDGTAAAPPVAAPDNTMRNVAIAAAVAAGAYFLFFRKRSS